MNIREHEEARHEYFIMLKKMKSMKTNDLICRVIILSLLFSASIFLLQTHIPFSFMNPCIWTDCLRTVHPCHTPPFSLFSHSNKENNISGENLVRALIDDFRERTRVAAASLEGNREAWNGTLTSEQVIAWESKNPCRSRTELTPMYSLRKHSKDLPLNPLWEEVFQEYSNYHRVCMAAVGDIAEYFKQKKTHTGCQFMVADTDSEIGIGNRLQVIANSVFYGLITRRVILLPTSHEVGKSICEPIIGSTWVLDSETFPTPPEHNRNIWQLSTEVFESIDKHQGVCKQQAQQARDSTSIGPLHNVPYAAGDFYHLKQPYQRFFCPTEQSFYSDITWVYLAGCIYTIPKMFAIPTFRPTLEALFPDRVILTRIFRSFLLPGDPVWTRVKRLHDTYLQPAERRVGIQMRFGLKGWKSHKQVHDLIEKRVVDCVSSHRILPKLFLHKNQTNVGGVFSNATRISVLVTSLYLGLHDVLKKMYSESPTVDGALVNVVQPTHENKQEFGVDVNTQAYTEILLLSFSDDLLVTPLSTFGGCAQAYGALLPWFIEHREDKKLASCEHSQTVEVCNQYTGKNFDCKYDKELGTKLFSVVVPDIEDCPQIEFPYRSNTEQGIHIRTTFPS